MKTLIFSFVISMITLNISAQTMDREKAAIEYANLSGKRTSFKEEVMLIKKMLKEDGEKGQYSKTFEVYKTEVTYSNSKQYKNEITFIFRTDSLVFITVNMKTGMVIATNLYLDIKVSQKYTGTRISVYDLPSAEQMLSTILPLLLLRP